MPKKSPPKAPRPSDRMASMAGKDMHSKDRQKRELSAEVLRARRKST
jgi:hypothetical protein